MTSKNQLLNPIIVILLFLFSGKFLYAGDTGMSEEQMEALMKNAEKMQECMAKIDQSEIQKLSEKSQKMQKDVQALCKAGKKDKAQDMAMKFGQEAASSKAMQDMKKCGEMMQQSPGMAGIEDFSTNDQHVCDSF